MTLEATTKKASANSALSALSLTVNGPRGEKKRERDAAKAARKEDRLQAALKVLDNGVTGRKVGTFNARDVLMIATGAVKNGATAEQFLACGAMHGVADWHTAVEPVVQYATAKGCTEDQIAQLVQGFCQPPAPAAKAPAPKRQRKAPATKAGKAA